MEITNNRVDPYRQFNFAGGFLCEGRASKMHVIELSQVISHVAWTRLKGDENEELVHVLPVDRVRYFFSSDDPGDQTYRIPAHAIIFAGRQGIINC